MRLGLTATAIDTANKVVGLSDSTSIDYENLVIATGCRSRLGGRASNMTGWDLPGVHTLRSLADSQALKEQLVEGRRLVIIGAGWIGMEVAASARAAGVQVTVLTPDEVPLAVAMERNSVPMSLACTSRTGCIADLERWSTGSPWIRNPG